MLNREYLIRSKLYGIGHLIAEGILRRDPDRPAEHLRPQRVVHEKKFTGTEQMELFPEPLADVFPEAYECAVSEGQKGFAP